jgi:Ca2+-binding RTX toxin-like protein
VQAAVNAGTFRNALDHFLLFGSAEGRAATNTAGQSITNNPGSTFTLTTSADNLTGTTGNDTFNSVIDTGTPANSTLTAADVINGGAGTDTLNVTVVGNGTSDIPGGAQLTSIEVISVRNMSTGVATVTAPTGLTLVEARGGSGDVTVNGTGTNGLAQGARFEANATTGGAMTVNYVAAATQAQLGFFGATTGPVTVAGAGNNGLTSAVITTGTAASTTGGITFAAQSNLQTVTINANANLNTSGGGGIIITPTVSGIATLNVNGAAANVNVGTLDSDFATVNASGMTAGGLTATISNLAVNITGGAGNDVITTGGVLTGTVNAGAGTGDRLIVTNSAHISAAVGARYTGFEVLQANNGVSINATHVAGITDLILNGGALDTGFTSVSAAQAARVQMLDAGAGDAIIAVTGASNPGQIDTVTITVSDNLAAVNTIILGGNLVLAGVENLNLVLTDNYVQNSDLVAGAPALATVTLSGAGTANLTTGAITTANFTINGASATGSLTLDGALATVGVRFDGGSAADTLTGSAHADILNGGAGADIIFGGGGNDIINGGDGNDTITGGAGADTLTGGAGADTFVYTNLADSLVANFDTIVDFVAGTDKIHVGTLPAAVQQGVAYTANGTGNLANDIGNAISSGGGILAHNVAVVTITGTGAGTYLVINDNTLGYQAGSDAVIRITGLTGTLSVADFV